MKIYIKSIVIFFAAAIVFTIQQNCYAENIKIEKCIGDKSCTKLILNECGGEGTDIFGKYSIYPQIMYNNIIYMPIYEYSSAALGIVLEQTTDSVNILSDKDVYKHEIPFIQERPRMMTKGITINGDLEMHKVIPNDYFYDIDERLDCDEAKIIDEAVFLNDSKVDDSRYPFIRFGGIVYMPMTWENCVSLMGWEYEFDSENNLLHVAAKKAQYIIIPEVNVDADKVFVYINNDVKAELNIRSPLGAVSDNESVLNVYLENKRMPIDDLIKDVRSIGVIIGSAVAPYPIGHMQSIVPDFEYENEIFGVNIYDSTYKSERLYIDIRRSVLVGTGEATNINPVFFMANASSLYVPFVDGLRENAVKTIFPVGTLCFNGKRISVYEIGKDKYGVRCEDLVNLGYDMVRDEESRTTTLVYNENKEWSTPELNMSWEGATVLDSDCKIILDNKLLTETYNIGGYTVIPLSELRDRYKITVK